MVFIAPGALRTHQGSLLQKSCEHIRVVSIAYEMAGPSQTIGASQAEKTKLVFYRGPTTFLYGPTQPADEWYVSEGLV